MAGLRNPATEPLRLSALHQPMSGLPDIGQPANAAFTASAPKDMDLISGPSFGLSPPGPPRHDGGGRAGKGVMFTICSTRSIVKGGRNVARRCYARLMMSANSRS